MKHLPVKAMTKSVVTRERWEGVRERDRAALEGLRGRGVEVNCETWCAEVGRLLRAENGCKVKG